MLSRSVCKKTMTPGCRRPVTGSATPFNGAVAVLGIFLCLFAGCTRDPLKKARYHFEQGQRWASRGKVGEAIVEYRRAIQNDPKMTPAHWELAQLYLKQKESLNAFRELSTVVRLDPAHRDARLQLAELRLRGRNFAEAKKEAETILAQHAEDSEALLVVAESARRLKDARLARSTIDRVLRLDPTNGRAWNDLAILQLEAGQLSASEQSLRKAIQHKPEWVMPVATLAAMLVQRNAWAEARTLLGQAVASNPTNLDAHYLLASFWLQQRRLPEAEGVFRTITSLGQDEPAHRGALSRFYVFTGRLEAAEQQLQAILAQYPDDVLNRRRLAALFASTGRSALAERLLDAVLKQKPSDAQASLIRGQLRVEDGRIDEGLQDLHRAAQTEARWALPHYYSAVAYLKRGDRKVAEARLQSALQLEPGMLAPRLILAQLQLDSGMADRALNELNRVVTQRPPIVEPYVMRSVALAKQGEYSQAEKGLLPLVEDFPQEPSRALVYRTLGWLKFHQRRFAEARQMVQEALTFEPTAREALYLLGMTYLGEKQADRGLEDLRARVEAHPQWAVGREVLGQVFLLAGRYPEGERYLRQAAEMDPKLVSAGLTLGESLMAQGKLEQAVEVFSKLAERQPRLAVAQMRLAQVHEQRGDWIRAGAHYRKVLEIAPEDAVAKNNLAWLYCETGGNLDVALRLAQEAKASQPDDPTISDTLGWIYVQKQSYGNAIQLLRQSVDRKPQTALYHFHLGVAYFRSGKKAEAKHSLETALKLQPDFPELGKAKEMLGALAN